MNLLEEERKIIEKDPSGARIHSHDPQGMGRREDHFPPEGAGVVRRNWRVLLRIFFALVWSLDAYFKWLYVHNGESLVDTISSSAQGQPGFVRGWIDFWAGVSASMPNFTLLIAIFETLIALFLLLGLLVPVISVVGIVFNLLIWSTAEGLVAYSNQAPPT